MKDKGCDMAVYNIVLNEEKFRKIVHAGPPFVNSYGIIMNQGNSN